MRNKRCKTFVSIFKWHFLNDWIFFGCHAEVIAMWKNFAYSLDETRLTGYKFKKKERKKFWIMKNITNVGKISRLCDIVDVPFWFFVIFKYHWVHILFSVEMIRSIWNFSNVNSKLAHSDVYPDRTSIHRVFEILTAQCSWKVFVNIMSKYYFWTVYNSDKKNLFGINFISCENSLLGQKDILVYVFHVSV